MGRQLVYTYGLTRCGQECYTSSELYRLQQDGKAFRRAGQWLPGPPAAPDPPSPRGPISASLLPWLLGVPQKITHPTSLSWLHGPQSHPPTHPSTLAIPLHSSPGGSEAFSTTSPLTVLPLDAPSVSPSSDPGSTTVPTLGTVAPSSPSGGRGSRLQDLPAPPYSPSSASSCSDSSQALFTPEETAFWRHLRGRYGYRDNKALRLSVSNLSDTQRSLTSYLNDTPTASPGQLAPTQRVETGVAIARAMLVPPPPEWLLL